MEHNIRLLKKGTLALLKRNLPAAYRAFAAAYHEYAQHWEPRDMAVTGLNDILDTRTYEIDKEPSILMILGWRGRLAPESSAFISDERVLILLENFLRRTVFSPETI